MKNPLFSFLTIRTPQAISLDDKQHTYVNLSPDILSLSHYFRELSPGRFHDIRLSVRRRAQDFTHLLGLVAIKSEFAPLYGLFRVVRSESYRLSYNGMQEEIEELGATLLDHRAEARIWDNFAHYLWVDPQQEEIDALSAILLANKFLESYLSFRASGGRVMEREQRQLRRIINGKVVLPLDIDNRVAETSAWQLSREQRTMLETAHDRLMDARELHKLQNLKAEVITLKASVLREMQAEAEHSASESEAEARRALSALNLNLSFENDIQPLIRSKAPSREFIVSNTQLRSRLQPAFLRTFVQQETTKDNADATLAQLNLNIDSLSARVEEEIVTEDEETMLVFGSVISAVEKIPPRSLLVKAHSIGEGLFDYYLSYHFTDPMDRLMGVSGQLSADQSVQSFQAVEEDTKENNYQLFKLNETPVSRSVASFNILLTRAVDIANPQPLPPFQVFTTIPHVGRPDFGDIDDIVAQPPPLFGVNKLGIADFRRVEQEVACYVAGEVSHIENILASEYKERVSRSFSMIETENEVGTEYGIEQQSDTEQTDKLEMSAEASSVVREEMSQSFNVGAGVSGKYMGVSFSVNSGYNFNSANSKEESNSQAMEIAQSLTQRIQEKITQKRTARRRSTYRREFEDTHKHGYDNREGQEHVVGIYRWVDKIYNNYLVNYGRRLMYEFTIPEPARNFIVTKTEQARRDGLGLKKPKSLRRRGIGRPGKISRRNYLRHAAYYGVDVPVPPAETITLARAYSEATSTGGDEGFSISNYSYNEIEVPSGYYAKTGTLMPDVVWDKDILSALRNDDEDAQAKKLKELQGKFSVLIGGEKYSRPPGGIYLFGNEIPLNSINEDGEIREESIHSNVPLSVSTHRVDGFSVNVTVKCQLTQRAFRAWQLEVHNLLKEAYEKKLAVFENAVANYESEDESTDLNPRFRKQLMEEELKRLCIYMITHPFMLEMSHDHYGVAEDGKFAQLRLTPELDRHASRVKFFEQAFDWELMAYIFYPYFYADESTWKEKMTMESGSKQLFEAFLKAGMSRVVLPVRLGFEIAVMYYLQTGEVWLGGDFVLDVKNDLYLSVADELIEGRETYTVEDSWQSKIPTNLTILQARSASLDAEGLPCADPEARLAVGKSLLNPVLPSESADNQ